MQRLQFEAAWDKTIAKQDRELVEKIFNETKYVNQAKVLCSPIREAINHKEELLLTVLVHNFTDQYLLFNQTRLQYRIHEEIIADKKFTIPALVIPPKVSMPWTFIFSRDILRKSSIKNGRLEII